MNKKLLIIACLLSLLGCRQASNKSKIPEETLFDESVTRIKIEDIDLNSILKYSDIFENIRFIRLDTNDSSLIGHIDKIVATEDKYIILDESLAKSVFVFNQDGKFLNHIGSSGGGPQEYVEPKDIAYDKYNDELLVFCHHKKTILRYKLDGSFVGKIILNWDINSIFVSEKNAYLLHINNRIQPNGNQTDYNIYIINNEGTLLKKILPYNKEMGELTPPRTEFFNYRGEIIFAPYYFSTIFKLENDELSPKYYLDFGEHGIPEAFFKNISNREFVKQLRESDYAYNVSTMETSSHVISRFVYRRFIFNCFYDKESRVTKTSMAYFNDMHCLAIVHSPFYSQGNELIFYTEPHSFTSFKELTKDLKGNQKNITEALLRFSEPFFTSELFDERVKKNMREVMQSAKIDLTSEEIDFINISNEDDNPILMIATLKKF